MASSLQLCQLLQACINRDHLTPSALLRYPLRERVRPQWRSARGGAAASHHDVYERLLRWREELAQSPAAAAAPTRGAPAAAPVVAEVAALPAEHPARRIAQLGQLVEHFHRRDLFSRCELILHGSLASADWCAYSDMDLVLVVRDSAFRSHGELKRFCHLAYLGLRYVYDFDPLQHHGYLVVAEAASSGYDRALFPPEVLGAGYTLSGRPFRAAFSVHADRRAALDDLQWFEQRMRRFATAEPPGTPYHVKAALSVLMLGPTLFFTAIGSPCFKRDAFARIRPQLPAALREPLDAATAARRSWSPPPCHAFRSLVRRSSNPTLWSRLHARLPLSAPAAAAPCLTPRMRQRAHELAQTLSTWASEHAAAS